MDIKVLGPGCARCAETERLVREAVSETGVDARIRKVTDIREISKHGVFMTPAVVIDGDVMCVGKVPEKKEIKTWLGK